MAGELIHCGCGEIFGERCDWVGPVEETVLVEYMPEWLRSSHEAAGNSGRYPLNGADRVRVQKTCAELLLGTGPEWVSIVSDAR